MCCTFTCRCLLSLCCVPNPHVKLGTRFEETVARVSIISSPLPSRHHHHLHPPPHMRLHHLVMCITFLFALACVREGMQGSACTLGHTSAARNCSSTRNGSPEAGMRIHILLVWQNVLLFCPAFYSDYPARRAQSRLFDANRYFVGAMAAKATEVPCWRVREAWRPL